MPQREKEKEKKKEKEKEIAPLTASTYPAGNTNGGLSAHPSIPSTWSP